MRKGGHRRRWARLSVLTAAVVALLFVATCTSFWHLDAPGSEATCPICHLAHASSLRGVPSAMLSAPAVVARVVPAEPRAVVIVPENLDSPPRAPPV